MKTLCIGIGNEYRRDDGAGRAAARALKAKNLPDVQIIESDGDGAALMDAWQAAESVFLIDAVASGQRPGTVFRLDAVQQAVPLELVMYSSHAFGVAEAVELARALGTLPERLVIYGIVGRDFTTGVGFSREVANAIPLVVERIVGEI